MKIIIREIILVFAPLVILGVTGTLIGPETLAGGALVNLGYVAGVIVAT